MLVPDTRVVVLLKNSIQFYGKEPIVKKQRPLFISIVCFYFIFLNLMPTAPLLTEVFSLIKEFGQGGFDQFHSAFKANIDKPIVVSGLKVLVVYIAIGGLWWMRKWGLFLFRGSLTLL